MWNAKLEKLCCSRNVLTDFEERNVYDLSNEDLCLLI